MSLIRKLKGNRAPKHVDTFDFSTLYTNIPDQLLLDSLGKLILEAYRVRGATFICVSYNNIFWSNSQHREYFNVSASKLVEYITFLVDNIFVAAGDQVFKQTVGIPMGTDCAPLLANLFLFFYEYNYVKEKLKTNHASALKWRYTARYIDDLLTINNPSFQNEGHNIYPPQLSLKKTTECPEMASFLDICIHNKDNKLTTSVYDKRDKFNFYMVKFPRMDSNIPNKPAYGVYISQLVRILCRICDTFVDFNNRHVNSYNKTPKTRLQI